MAHAVVCPTRCEFYLSANLSVLVVLVVDMSLNAINSIACCDSLSLCASYFFGLFSVRVVLNHPVLKGEVFTITLNIETR